METLLEKKITKATFKKFIRDNKDNLFINVTSDFDGMTDCVQQVNQVPHKVIFKDEYNENTLGIVGVWLVGSSRDYFKAVEDEISRGIRVTNSCGSFTLSILK